VGREDAAAPAGVELQLGRGGWKGAHGPTTWRAAALGERREEIARGAEGAALLRVGVLPVEGEGTAAPPPATVRRVEALARRHTGSCDPCGEKR